MKLCSGANNSLLSHMFREYIEINHSIITPCYYFIFLCHPTCRTSCIDMYMSYRWRESFNTVRSPSDSWRHHIGDWHVWAQNAERREGGWTIHPSRRWLINCARAAVLYVCLSIALTSCSTSMAETNLDAIRKQKTRNILKDMDWNEKWKCNSKRPQLQKPNQTNYKYSFCFMVQASEHVYVLPRTYTCHTDLQAKNITST